MKAKKRSKKKQRKVYVRVDCNWCDRQFTIPESADYDGWECKECREDPPYEDSFDMCCIPYGLFASTM